MASERQNFDNLMADLREANRRNDARKIVLSIGIYAEYIVNELLRLKLGYGLNEMTSQEYKIKILGATKIMEESEYHVLLVLNWVRNRYAHDLEIDLPKIEEKMKGIEINWRFDNPEKMNLPILNDFMNKNPLLKFQGSCLTKLAYLSEKVAKIKNEQGHVSKGITILIPPEIMERILIKSEQDAKKSDIATES